MASIRKKLSMAFGLNGESSSSTSKASSMDMKRSSLDSGYHSMIGNSRRRSQDGLRQADRFVASHMESSPERTPRKLHKAISSTFSGAMQAFSNTVRSTTSYVYPTTVEPELPSSEWAECETPKKSRRAAIMSSVRSGKHRITPRLSGARNGSPEMLQSLVPVTPEKAPVVDVEIPDLSLDSASLGKGSPSNGSQLLAGVNLPARPKKLWPGPTRLTVDQASAKDRPEAPHPGSSEVDDSYVEQENRLQHGLCSTTPSSKLALESPSSKISKRYVSDDKGYISEAESKAELSESNGLSPACLKYIAPGSPEARTSSPCHHKDPAAFQVQVVSSTSSEQRMIPSQISLLGLSELELSKSDTLGGNAEQIASLDPQSLTSSNQGSSFEDGLNSLLPSYKNATQSDARPFCKRLPSDSYDADAENLESSMGSRSAWERHRADRERRYMKILDLAADTESDEEMEPELGLERSPSRKPVHYAEDLVQLTLDLEGFESTPSYPTGDLHYAVEAIERLAFPMNDLVYAVEATDRPSVTTFDPLETVFQQRPMIRLSDKIDKPETLQVSDLSNASSSCVEIPSSPFVDVSPSRVELPSSPESSPVDVSAAPNSTVMTMKITDGQLIALGAGNLDGQRIRRFSSESTELCAKSWPDQQSQTAPEDAYEVGMKVEALFAPAYISRSSETRPVKEDSKASLRAASTSMPSYTPKMVHSQHVVDPFYEGDLEFTSIPTQIFGQTSHSAYCKNLEAGCTLPRQRSRTGTRFEHSRTASTFSEDTDDSCAITTRSPSCDVPPPFPSLHVRPEPACRVSSAINALATHGGEQIRIAGPANAGIKFSRPFPFNGLGDQAEEAESSNCSPKALEGPDSPEDYAQETLLEQYDPAGPSPGTTSSIRSPSNSNTPQETFSAAKSPSFVSSSPILSRKDRRKLKKKSSSGKRGSPLADVTMNAKNPRDPDNSSPKSELNKNSPIGKKQVSHGESARTVGGSVQKPSPKRTYGRKNRFRRNQASLEESSEIVEGIIRWKDHGSKSKSSNESLGDERQAPTLPVTSGPSEMKILRDLGLMSFDEDREHAESALEDSIRRFEPKFRISHFDSISDVHSTGGTSYTGHELESVSQADPPVPPRHDMGEGPQQDSNEKVTHSVCCEETCGKSSELYNDASCAPGHNKNCEPSPEAKKKMTAQKELQRKSDRACNRVAGKLKNGDIRSDHVREDDSAHRDGRPPWRH